MASSRVGGVEKVLSKCQSCINEGNFYEAHQMYRTLCFRYKGQKKYAEAINLLYEGSMTLLQHNQHSSGADLALLLVNLLNTSMTPVTDEYIEKVVNIFKKMEFECQERHTFMTAAIRWSMKVDPNYKSGHPDLHQKFGLILWKEKNYVQARYHLVHSSDGRSCAAMLIEQHVTRGYRSEIDLFIAQAVLQYLCLQNKDTAQVVFYTYTREHPDVEDGPPFYKPLLNFIWFLLLALDGGKVTVFTILCEKYEASINRDPMYKEYLDRIGQLFFGLPPPKSPQQGIFGNLLQSLIGAGNDDEEDVMQQSTNSQMSQVELD